MSLLALSRWIGVDHRRFLITSESPPDFTGAVAVLILILEYTQIFGAEIVEGVTDSRTSSAVYKALITLAQDSHPLLRWIGISKIDFYANTSERSIIAPELDLFFTEPQTCKVKYEIY
jgi:hypothetical protein